MQLSQRRERLALKPPALQLRVLVRLADWAWLDNTIVARPHLSPRPQPHSALLHNPCHSQRSEESPHLSCLRAQVHPCRNRCICNTASAAEAGFWVRTMPHSSGAATSTAGSVGWLGMARYFDCRMFHPPTAHQAPTARPILAWGIAPGARTKKGPRAEGPTYAPGAPSSAALSSTMGLLNSPSALSSRCPAQ